MGTYVKPAGKRALRVQPWWPMAAGFIVVLSIACAATDAPSTPAKLPTTESIVGQLVAANRRRAAALRGYSATRYYKLQYSGIAGSRNAEMKVAATFIAPDRKEFKVLSSSGSGFLISRVLEKLLAAEKSAIEEDSGRSFDLTPENYDFKYLRNDRLPSGDAYLLEVKPRTSNKYLYTGNIWINAHDFAVARIQASPAKTASFWVKSTDINLVYAKFGNFWLPVHNDSSSRLRVSGQAIMTIDYTDYRINDAQQIGAAQGAPSSPAGTIPPAAAVTGDSH
ncbi:MAG: hypothetical protein H0X25_00840 [Acidobacteriales bacterium]|nr:hypothetical protein [Terriglobales bacterium]